MRGMEGNITPQAIVKAAKCMGITHQVCSAFEEHTMTVKAVCDTHSHPSVEKDLEKIVEVLWENNVFTTLRKREHVGFERPKCGLLQKYPRKVLLKKVQETINRIDNV